jgi:Lipoate synthase
MLRLEARNSQVPIERKPPWIKTRLRTGPSYTELKSLVRSEGLHTVCEEAGCPNIFECWEDREATFLIGGDQCTRRCDFCQIDTGQAAATRRGRAAPGRGVRRRHGPEVRDRDRRRA